MVSQNENTIQTHRVNTVCGFARAGPATRYDNPMEALIGGPVGVGGGWGRLGRRVGEWAVTRKRYVTPVRHQAQKQTIHKPSPTLNFSTILVRHVHRSHDQPVCDR